MAKGKFQKWLTADGLTLLEGWARDGLTDEEIAHNIGITRSTYYEWLKRFPDISDATRAGKEVSDFEVQQAFYRRCIGYTIQETKQTYNSNRELTGTVIVTKEIPPDVTACIKWLCNRRPDKWRDHPVADANADALDKLDGLLLEFQTAVKDEAV